MAPLFFVLLRGMCAAGATGLLSRSAAAKRVARLAGLMYFGGIALGVAAYFVMHNNALLWPRYYTMYLPLAWVAVAAGLVGTIERGCALLLRSETWGPRLLQAALVACVVTVGWTGAAQLKGCRLDMVNDWRQVTDQLKSHVHPNDVVVHMPAGFAYLGFACYWDQPNLNTTLPDLEPTALVEMLERTQSMSGVGPIWFLLSWGNQVKDRELIAEMKPHGFVLADEVRVDTLVALKFQPTAAP
jgi:hypothetical protein